MILQLLDLKDGSEKTLNSVIIDTDYIVGVEKIAEIQSRKV